MNIWWIRRDFRLDDNPALTAALQAGAPVIPAFILDDHLLGAAPEKRKAFLFAGLKSIDLELRKLGSSLIVRRGNPIMEIPRLVAECQAGAVFAEADISPYATRRDGAISSVVQLGLVHGCSFHPPAAVQHRDGRPYRMFTPYQRAWMSLPYADALLPAPKFLGHNPEVPSIPIPEASLSLDFIPGEEEAQHRLAGFIEGPIYEYGETRDRLDLDGTSQLSPYLKFGMLSIRRAVAAVRHAADKAPGSQARAGCATWLNELIWREFYRSILHHFPCVLSGAFKTDMSAFAWQKNADGLMAWQSGMTGYPVVDAGMRQLAATGWMHNRARMITASFLVKHLLIHWQEGESWFMQHLVDGDPSSNNGGWQWVAGTGTDATPYFRIFNPILQGQKFDPHGEYVRRWVPELAAVPAEKIHTPWEMNMSEQNHFGVMIGKDYPAPIIDHKIARERALVAFRKHQL